MAFRDYIPSPRQTAMWATTAASLIAPWEGLATTAYPDKLAHGLPTVCYGMTSYDRPVKLGDTYTKQECVQFLAEDVVKYKAGLDKCIHVPLSDNKWAATVSLAYNVGVQATCRSTYVRRLNAGDPKACDSILAFNKASGHVVQGLVNRRNAERKVCMEG
jgi:lysozyme